MRLIDERAADGSRHFAEFPKTTPWGTVRDHVLLLRSAEVVNFIEEGMASPWLDFSFRGHRFLVHCHSNQLRLFVRDPQCSDLLLYEVGTHFARLLGEMKDNG